MSEMFSTLGTWNWLIFGVVLMALELIAPGVFLFWLGLAALLVGLLSFTFHPSWQLQILMFAVFAAAAVPLWRRIARNGSAASKSNPFLNKRADALVGRVFTLEKPIIDGAGTVRIDDTIWRVAGPDAPAGSRVRIVQADGASLTVAVAWRFRAKWIPVRVKKTRQNKNSKLRPLLAPALGKTVQRQEVFVKLPAQRRELVSAGGHQFDQVRLAQVREPGLQHGRRGFVTGGAQGARRQRLIAQFPQDAQAPAPSQEVEQRHDRPARCRAADVAFFHG